MFLPYKLPPWASGDKGKYDNDKERGKCYTKLLITSSFAEEHFYTQFYFFCYGLLQEHEQIAEAGRTQEFGSFKVQGQHEFPRMAGGKGYREKQPAACNSKGVELTIRQRVSSAEPR